MRGIDYAAFVFLYMFAVGAASELYCKSVSPPAVCPSSEICSDVENTRQMPERLALERIYRATNGPNWFEATGWLNESVSHCGWAGVCCDPDTCSVESVSLDGNNLTGELPDLHGLPSLIALSLTCNPLTKAFNAFTSQNSLLEILRLDHCLLEEQIPFKTFSSLFFPVLKILLLNDNYLFGSIPGNLLELPQLQELDVGSNLLNGSIPEFSSKTLFGIRAHDNLLGGPLPPSVFAPPRLYVDLSNNQFNSSLPNLQSASKISEFVCTNCGLIGDLQEDFFLLFNDLERISLSFNRLSSQIPESLFLIPRIRSVHLDHNALKGFLPSSLQYSPTIVDLFLNDNLLEGDLSEEVLASYVDLRNNSGMKWSLETGPQYWKQDPTLTYIERGGVLCSGLNSPNLQTRVLADGSYYNFLFCNCQTPCYTGTAPDCYRANEWSHSLVRWAMFVGLICMIFISILFIMAYIYHRRTVSKDRKQFEL